MFLNNLKKVLMVFLLIQYIALICCCFIYAGILYEYKNVCPRGENISLISGGVIFLDDDFKNYNEVISIPLSNEELNKIKNLNISGGAK